MNEQDKLYELNGNVQSVLAKLDAIQAGLLANSEALRKHIDWSSEEHKKIDKQFTDLDKSIFKVSSIVGVIITLFIFGAKEAWAYFVHR